MMMAGPYHQPTTLEEARTLWIGNLPYGADENYIYGCFAQTGEVQSVKLIRNKLSGLPEGYGFIDFISHEAAEKVLHTYNGAQMPGTNHTFRLNWASFSSGEKRPHEVGEVAKGNEVVIPSVGKTISKLVCAADEMRPDAGYCSTSPVRSAAIPKALSGSQLQNEAAKDIWCSSESLMDEPPIIMGTMQCPIYKFGDENEKTRAMTEMNGLYCSTRPMRISAAIPKKAAGSQLQYGAAKAMYPAAAYTAPQAQTVLPDSDLTNTTIFIGNLDPNVTEEELRQICVQFGELIYVKIPVGKGCGFVQYASRASAENAVQRLHGTVFGQQVVRISWGRSPGSKQDQSAAWTLQADPNQWSAYYGYGYDPYAYAQDPSYAYDAYAEYSQHPQQVEGATGMASATGSHVPSMKQKYDPMNLPDIDKGAKVVTDPNTGRSKGYGFVKSAAENEKSYAMTEMNGAYCSTRPVEIGAAIPKTSSTSQLQDGAKDILELKLGTLRYPIKQLISFPVRIGSVQPTVLVESKKKKKKKKKNKRKKRKKRTASPSPTTDLTLSTDSYSSAVGSSAPLCRECLPVWSVPWSGLPCGCPWPVGALDALNTQPTQYGLHHLPEEPNEILASFKPWLQRFYAYGGSIPCPRDLLPLEEFKEKFPLSEPYVLHSGKEIGLTTISGRFVIVGLVEDVVSAFKSGYSWGGNFGKQDLTVQIGVRCYISKVPNLPGTYKNLCKDLDQLAESLIPYFRGEHLNGIAFIEHLYNTLKNPPPISSTIQKRERYLKFLKRHPARADPLSASSLLVGIVQTYKAMGLSDKEAFERVVDEIDFSDFLKWIEKVESDPLWNKVYTAKERKSAKKRKKGRYKRTPISLATFLRHFVIHSPEHTLLDGVQLMKTIDEVDYLVGDFFGNFIAELFKALVYEFDMDKDILKSVWRMYDVGEDRNKVIKRIWKSETELDFMLETQEVMGRSSPNDKLLLVKALSKNDHVVAVTGDGTNDAPALHEADIGLSMGIQGTEVAKESSDIIVLDDNFASVVKVVRWGRSVFAKIQKFIQFKLTVTVVALVINVVAAISSGNVPLNAVQLLWVNLITVALGALALAAEPPTDQLMKRTPVGRREPLVTNIMWRNLFIQAVYQVAVLLTLNFGGRNLLHLTQDTLEHSNKVKNSFIFNTFVLCQVFNEFNSRKPEERNIFEGVSGNHLFLAGVSVAVVLQVIIIEFLGKFTSTVRLSWELWLVSVCIAFVSWPLAFVGKFIPVPRTPLKNLILKCWPKRNKQGDEGPTPPV